MPTHLLGPPGHNHIVDELTVLSAGELLDGYRSRAFSPVEVLDSLAARIDEHNPTLMAFTTLCLDRAREEARAADSAYRRGEAAGPLCGVPIGAKDTFDSAGM
jgi:Asp-tRNA(Asn)/Glu-tRNA(Gln) amidotransferase A subunit family amidase